ncbi:ABC transporter permease [Jiangella sp. DSM 45060]|uniref:ABC transporter permease n=1 Tax=Jiangella sp. DSM 45060 TaxID=1798224 RepID=UPI000879A115|nr:ABC transporter permease [Jiangella sp. DSM 45060]SDT20179.1 peptide/nickel transport system permease protein [Jiangella sp. DSM 45060]
MNVELVPATPPGVTPPGRRWRPGRRRPPAPGGRQALRRFLGHPPAVAGLVVLAVVALVAIGADWIAPYDPQAVSQSLLQPPSGEHLLGTDTVGRDILSQIIHGGRVSLIVALVTGLGTLVIGSLVGAVAGFYGGRVDAVLMRIAEVFQVIPSFALALIIVAVLGANLAYICAALVMALWPQMARLVRGEVLRIMTTDMVAAARTVGHSNRRIIMSDVLPNALPPLIVQATIDLGSAILLQAGLAFLGLGDPTNLSWGDILQQAQRDLSAWWMSVPAGVVIFLVVLAANFVGDGLNRALRPTSSHL